MVPSGPLKAPAASFEGRNPASPLLFKAPSRLVQADDEVIRGQSKPLPPTPAGRTPAALANPTRRERVTSAAGRPIGGDAESDCSDSLRRSPVEESTTRKAGDHGGAEVPQQSSVVANAAAPVSSSQGTQTAPLLSQSASRQQPDRRRSLSVPNLRARSRQQRQEVPPPVPSRSQSRARSIRSLVPTSLRSHKDPITLSSTPRKRRIDDLPRTRYRVTGGLYASPLAPRPDVFLAEPSSASDADSDTSSEPELIIKMPSSSERPPSRPLRFVETRNGLRPGGSDDEAERSSMRRVLREMEDSQAERAAWSDSAIRGVAYSLSARLAERDARRARRRLRRSSAEGQSRVRSRTALRRGAGGATESETDAAPSWRAEKGVSGRRGTPKRTPARHRRPVKTQSCAPPQSSTSGRPQESPPVPTSFQPFHFPAPRSSRSGSARSSEEGPRASLSQSLRRLTRRSAAKIRPSLSMSSLNEGTPRHVLGRPIRHVRQAASASTADSIPYVPPFTDSHTFWSDTAEECSGEAISTPQRFGSPGRKASVVSQNAFLTLPPHLHHLLRAPEELDEVPAQFAEDSSEQPCASPSAREAAELTLLLADRLGENSPARSLQTPLPTDRPRTHPFARVPSLDVARADRISPPEARECESTPRSMSSEMPVFEDLSNLFWKLDATRSPSPTPRAARPAPNPLQQQPWSATSFRRLYLDGSYQGSRDAASRDPERTQPDNNSYESFLTFDRNEPDGDGISRGCVSPASFIDLDYDFDPHTFALKRASSLSEDQRPKLVANDSRSSTGSRLDHLSIDSRFFLSPLKPISSPYLSSDVSRNSTLNGRLEDFPTPPSFVPSGFSETCCNVVSATKAESVKLNKFNGGGEGAQRVLGSTDSRLEAGCPADSGGIARRSTGSAESAWFADSSESD